MNKQKKHSRIKETRKRQLMRSAKHLLPQKILKELEKKK